MISHSLITLVWMLTAPWLVGPVVAAAFISAWWFSREQYWAELGLRKVGRDGIRDVLGTIVSVWNPTTYKNMDLIAPVAVAWVIAGVFVMAQ